jgi:hypothetical protein
MNTLLKYLTVVSMVYKLASSIEVAGSLPRVLGNVFSNKRLKSGSLILAFMSTITFCIHSHDETFQSI